MGLYDQANLDNEAILTDLGGFGVPMTVTRPDGTSAELVGMAADIGVTIDVETEQAVAGRTVHATIPMAPLFSAFGSLPTAVPSQSMKPWRIAMQLPGETTLRTFRVTETMPDRLGCVVCFLEDWE